MEIRLLGPVELAVGGRAVDIGPRQRRAVLAALAVDAGTPVPIDTLAARVWGPAPPEAPRSALYAHLTRLRHVLGQLGEGGGDPARLGRVDAADGERTRPRMADGERARPRMADGERARLGRVGDGYVLDIDRQLVDLHRFQALAEAGRAVPPAGETRVRMLREAMYLWRGQPLSTLTSDWAVRVRRSAESLYVGLAGAWGAEELRLGNAEAVAVRLARIVEAFPMAEPLVAVQMRALCAVGRTAEALQCYAEARTAIVEQLGAEPGPELRRLHVAVLRGELDEPYPEPPGGTVPAGVRLGGAAPAGAVPGGATPARAIPDGTAPDTATSASVAPATHVPRQLPADISRFVGHRRELASVLACFVPAGERRPAPVVTVYGAAGTGKSTLALHVAHQLTDQFPDGQVYLDLRGSSAGTAPLSPAGAVARLLRTLGVAAPYAPVEVDEAAALFRSLVAGRRLLLLLDNAADASQVEPLLPSGTGCGTVVTSRQPLAGLGDTSQVWVGPLSVPEGVALLAHWVGEERVAAEPDAAVAIACWCEGLPLALRIAGARLVARPGWPLAELRDRLADERRRLDNLELDGVGLRASMAGSYRRLSHSADPAERATAEAFTVLGAAEEPVLDRSAAARLLARSEADAERMLERLVDAQLMETSAPGSYRMGELLRLYARERLAGLPEV